MTLKTDIFLRICATLLMSSFVGGCLAGNRLPHLGLAVDLDRANASKSDVAALVQEYLVAHHFTYAGPAGYDALNNTSTVVDFYGPEEMSASIYLAHEGVVLVGLDQNAPALSPEAKSLFAGLQDVLQSKWNDAVSPTPDHR